MLDTSGKSAAGFIIAQSVDDRTPHCAGLNLSKSLRAMAYSDWKRVHLVLAATAS
jgi:hypothetical protein